MTELATCPFCRSEYVENVGYFDSERQPQMTWHVVCDGCGCRTQLFGDKAEAIAAWNRRATPPTPAWRDIETVDEATTDDVLLWYPEIDGSILVSNEGAKRNAKMSGDYSHWMEVHPPLPAAPTTDGET